METNFAPAGRDSAAELQHRIDVVRNTPLLQAMIDALPIPLTILNESRQILAANDHLMKLLGVGVDELVGKRTGEVLGCTFWPTGPDGCGTTKHCLTCGAVGAIVNSQKIRGQAVRECRISLDKALDGGAMDLRVTATAVDVDDQRFTVCAIEDISKQKRLAVLSRVFFHDVLNTAGCIQGYSQLLAETSRDDVSDSEKFVRLTALSDQLIGEIESQRDLILAESGDLEIDPQTVQTSALLDDLQTLYSAHSVAVDRKIVWQDDWRGHLMTDARLLARVLGNMIKNALEATDADGTVAVRCFEDEDRVVFSVHNASVMVADTKVQVFHRSFSTKEQTGRGVGTYSMKLLGESYLRGHVDFASDEPHGTTFTITLPKVLLGPSAAALQN